MGDLQIFLVWVLPSVLLAVVAGLVSLQLLAEPHLLRSGWQELRALLAEPAAVCPSCGAVGKALGRTAASRWFYCDCGHTWRDTDDREAVA